MGGQCQEFFLGEIRDSVRGLGTRLVLYPQVAYGKGFWEGHGMGGKGSSEIKSHGW